ncbi:MAG: hypothetical protein E7552_06790 [Ruminococcaceae bacterium]|nr:hypothetical protein [Oscillospiraceae bacterium]
MIVGMNLHNRTYTPYCNTQEQNLDDCAAARMKIIRFNSPAQTPEDIAEIRAMADGCHARGMEFLLCIDHYHQWQNWDQPLEELETFYEEFMAGVSAALQGAVDVYQVFNETDVACINGNIFNIVLPAKMGRELGEYDCVLCEKCLYAMRGALRGLKRGYPSVKTSMNFCWWHTALIYDLYEKGCRWDVIGIGWYSDGEELSSIDLIVTDVCQTIPDADIMICETNQWMNLHERWDEAKRDVVRNRESRNALQAEWTASFIQKVYDMHEPRFKGIIFYELLDEPRFEREQGAYHGESHFGFAECNDEGGDRIYKPAWYAVADKIRELGL